MDGKRMEEVLGQSQLACACCLILECSLLFSASQTSSDSTAEHLLPGSLTEGKETNPAKLTEEDLLQLHLAFSEAFKSITEFLNSLPAPLSDHDNPLILAFMRVLGAWLAEETLAVSSELYQLLPKLLELCATQLQQSSGENRCLENPLRFLLPGLSHLVAETEARAAVKTSLPPVLLQFLTALYSNSMRYRV